MKLPKRKMIRLKEYDYSTPGSYFITVCTKNRANYFWNNVGASIARPQEIHLNKNGEIVDEAIKKLIKSIKT